MRSSLRCGALTRRGTSCQAPAMAGRTRCRMHGGTASSGAKTGNKNALKHGGTTHEAKELQRYIRALAQRTNEIIDEM
ncbi:HGGxSTG domain-containing protein [Citreimonas salinaria]|uniref:HGGxSTG domain-containing protein n=1 Tax=Citreimonas salinaria TaxID=321339 RepID=UPI002481FE1B|nr:HGGxSTG domain-containing protein [Citreimonas salinaria]